MPSTATITAFYTFAPLTSIRSSEVNNNFGLFRGHLLPIDASATSISNQAYDLGATNYLWRSLYSQQIYLYQNTTGSVPASPSAGQMALYFKNDGTLYKKTPAGVETAVGSGGGGGSSVRWIEDVNPPVAVFEYNAQAYVFSDGLAQSLFAQVRVPSSYVAGTQINLLSLFYASGTSSTVLFRTEATLIRELNEAISSVANVYTSTAAAVTLATTANRLNPFTCDLTDASGLVNGVTVTAGDVLLVKLTRATGTSTLDATIPIDSSEVTFT